MSKIKPNAQKILEKRYYWRDDDGNLIEHTWNDLNYRVSNFVASAEHNFSGKVTVGYAAAKFMEMTGNLRFIANTPTLANAGRARGQLAACYVLPIGDSMEQIMDTLKAQALVQKSGGGTGFSFGCIRENGSIIQSNGMRAVGPLSVIRFMNYMMSEFIIQGGMRNGANMGVLPIYHPDIEAFISFKETESCKSFNVSIGVTDKFMESVINDGSIDLVSPHSGKIVQTLSAKYLFNKIVKSAWRTGDPGLLFMDTINAHNPTPQLGAFEATNPCGEQPLLPNESCTLGHLNLSSYYIASCSNDWRRCIDWEQYKDDIIWGVRFLDNVVELNHYPLPEIEQMHKNTNRKIGLGVMGLADLLIKLGVPYASPKAREISSEIARFHRENADLASYNLGLERGSFGAFNDSYVREQGWSAMRNASRTTVAPTGSTAIFADCSTGIEPLFGLILKREQAGMIMYEVHPLFQSYMDSIPKDKQQAVYDYYDLHGTLAGCPAVPENTQRLFAQANDIPVMDHILMQATWQGWIDSSISKTINMPSNATEEDVYTAYMLAWKHKCKGITIYRDQCRANQALSTSTSTATETAVRTMLSGVDDCYRSTSESTKPDTLYTAQTSLMCPECNTPVEAGGGCFTCKSCGWGLCKI